LVQVVRSRIWKAVFFGFGWKAVHYNDVVSIVVCVCCWVEDSVLSSDEIGQGCLKSEVFNCPGCLPVHCKKELAVFPSPAGMSLIKLFLGGNNLVFSRPERVWSVTSRLGTGKWLTLFYSVMITDVFLSSQKYACCRLITGPFLNGRGGASYLEIV
jgi:hypothetical protein